MLLVGKYFVLDLFVIHTHTYIQDVPAKMPRSISFL